MNACQGSGSQEGPWSQTYFSNKTFSAFFTVDVCANGAKAEAGTLAWSKAAAPEWTSGHCGLNCHLLAGGGKAVQEWP